LRLDSSRKISKIPGDNQINETTSNQFDQIKKRKKKKEWKFRKEKEKEKVMD